ncbi:MAG: macro domain-containing protein [Bryobacteraceae bacterium]|nr:macro domain-containing protein [Bryobacteraceae bacterium]
METVLENGLRLRLVEGDITQVAADAIVNAANPGLGGGGGVDGAIHRAGGPSLMQELGVIRRERGGCPTGSAVVTGAGLLPARFVFHAVGPVWRGGVSGEPAQLASCYTTCLRLAEERQLTSLAFPGISTGVYGYPKGKAAEVALAALRAHAPASLRIVILVAYDRDDFEVYRGLIS